MKLSVFIFASLLMCGTRLLAWGDKGHRIVAAIARGQMDKEVVELVDYYLKGISWEDAACWMDHPAENKKYEATKAMHLVTLGKDKTFVKSREPSAINQLDFCTSMIQKRNLLGLDMVAEHIKMLFHLVADLHQPLHTGYPDDKNGSNLMIKYNGRSTDLHTFWDIVLLDEGKIDVWKVTKYIFSLPQKDRTAIQKVDYIAWMNESRTTLPDVYAFRDATISKEYVEKNTPLAEKQLAKASLRLIAVLNTLFKS
jgi:hypothetical protein